MLRTSSFGLVGMVTARTIIAELPELGTLGRRAATKLVGVAPIAKDSGTREGQRIIAGGRVHVRIALYMATLVAVRHNDLIRAHYQHLVAAGMAKKVARVACMRSV